MTAQTDAASDAVHSAIAAYLGGREDKAHQMLKRPSEVTAFDWFTPILMELAAMIYNGADQYELDDPDEAYLLLPEASEPMDARAILAEQGIEMSATLMEGWRKFTTEMRRLARDAVMAEVHGDWKSQPYLDVLRAVYGDDVVADAVTRFLLIGACRAAGEEG